ncbi:hypothetical protein D3C80_2238560 [compost metagenome]
MKARRASLMFRCSASTSWVSKTLLPGALTSDARLPRVEKLDNCWTQDWLALIER